MQELRVNPSSLAGCAVAIIGLSRSPSGDFHYGVSRWENYVLSPAVKEKRGRVINESCAFCNLFFRRSRSIYDGIIEMNGIIECEVSTSSAIEFNSSAAHMNGSCMRSTLHYSSTA